MLGATPWSLYTDEFRWGFLQGGGFARVLKFAMATPDDGNRDTLLGFATALRIMKACLFYPPLQVLATRRGPRDRAARARGGGGSTGAGVGLGTMSPDEFNLIARALPPMTPPTDGAREAMKVADADLRRLLDKLVLVRVWYC